MNLPVKIAKLPAYISKGTKSDSLQSTQWHFSSMGSRSMTFDLQQRGPLWLPGRPQRQPFFRVASCRGIQKPIKVSGSPKRQVESWWILTLAPILGGLRMAIDCITRGSLMSSYWHIYHTPGVQVMSSKILLCQWRECPILLMDCSLGTTILPSTRALGSKKKLTLSEESKKYLLSLCLDDPETASKTVIFSADGWKFSIKLSISLMAAWHCCLEMKFLMTVQP